MTPDRIDSSKTDWVRIPDTCQGSGAVKGPCFSSLLSAGGGQGTPVALVAGQTECACPASLRARKAACCCGGCGRGRLRAAARAAGLWARSGERREEPRLLGVGAVSGQLRALREPSSGLQLSASVYFAPC